MTTTALMPKKPFIKAGTADGGEQNAKMLAGARAAVAGFVDERG